MYVSSPWKIAVGIAAVKITIHISNVALLKENEEENSKSKSIYIPSFRFTYIKALRSVLIDILEMG